MARFLSSHAGWPAWRSSVSWPRAPPPERRPIPVHGRLPLPDPSAATSASPEPSAATSASPELACPNPNGGDCLGEIPQGTHETTTFMPALTYTVPDGWANYEDLKG